VLRVGDSILRSLDYLGVKAEIKERIKASELTLHEGYGQVEKVYDETL
jgi:hypothetical protein